MASFLYSARDAAGRPSSGTLEALSESDARGKIESLGFAVEWVRASGGSPFTASPPPIRAAAPAQTFPPPAPEPLRPMTDGVVRPAAPSFPPQSAFSPAPPSQPVDIPETSPVLTSQLESGAHFFRGFLGWLLGLYGLIFFTEPLWRGLDFLRAALAPVVQTAFFVPVASVLGVLFVAFELPEVFRRRWEALYPAAFCAFVLIGAAYALVLTSAARASDMAWIYLADAAWWTALVAAGIFTAARAIRR